MYHAKDRTVDVPKTETSGMRGYPQLLTRLLIKTDARGRWVRPAVVLPQLPRPTGNQRDEVTVIRRRSQEVEY